MAPPDAAPPTEPRVLWLTDRTRYLTGTGRCRYERWLRNYYGPTGYGIVRKAESLPLATGKHAHQASEVLLGVLRDHDRLPTDDEVRAALQAANADYLTLVAERGYRGLLQSERSDRIVTEQQALITGLIWTFAELILPWLHQAYRVVSVETEHLHSLTPEGDMAIMLRQDCFAQARGRDTMAYFEIKTSGFIGEGYAQSWETKPQLPIGTFGSAERFGIPVTELYIIGLYKGRRVTVDKGLPTEWLRQDSPFCYGFRRPANPPLWQEDWKPTYRFVNDKGETKQVSRDHEKTFVNELASTTWPPVHDAFTGLQAGQPPAEWWARQLPKTVRAEQVFIVGPLVRQEAQIEALEREIAAEERDWQRRLWELYERSQQFQPMAPGVLEALAGELFPRSWDCRRYGTRHQCEYLPLCFKQPGWEDPLGSGKYVARRPHHQPELDQAVARGLLPPDAEEGAEDEGGEGE